MIRYSIEMRRSPTLTRDEIYQRLYGAFSRLAEPADKKKGATSSDNPGRETPLAAAASTPESATQEDYITNRRSLKATSEEPT